MIQATVVLALSWRLRSSVRALIPIIITHIFSDPPYVRNMHLLRFYETFSPQDGFTVTVWFIRRSPGLNQEHDASQLLN